MRVRGLSVKIFFAGFFIAAIAHGQVLTNIRGAIPFEQYRIAKVEIQGVVRSYLEKLASVDTSEKFRAAGALIKFKVKAHMIDSLRDRIEAISAGADSETEVGVATKIISARYLGALPPRFDLRKPDLKPDDECATLAHFTSGPDTDDKGRALNVQFGDDRLFNQVLKILCPVP